MKFSLIKKATLFLLLINLFTVNAQIENEIMNYTDSTSLIMQNGKKLMMQSLINKDYEKASEVYFYLQEEAIQQGLLAFSYTDILYINLISHNWGEWFDYIKHYESKIKLPVYSSTEPLTSRLYTITKDESATLIQEAQMAQLPNEELALIKLFLHVIEKDELGKEYTSQKAAFEEEYPSSNYETFISDFLPSVPTKGSWSWTMGTSVISPSGNYGDHFYSNAAFYMSTDINIGNVYASLFMNAGGLKVEKAFTLDNEPFEKFDRFSYVDGGLQLGYLVVNNTHLHIAPYATIGGATLESNIYKSTEYDDLEYTLIGTFMYGAGLHTLIKFYEGESNPYYGNVYGFYQPYPINNYFALKANIGYNFLAGSKYTLSKGNILYAQIGIVWGIGDF